MLASSIWKWFQEENTKVRVMRHLAVLLTTEILSVPFPSVFHLYTLPPGTVSRDALKIILYSSLH